MRKKIFLRNLGRMDYRGAWEEKKKKPTRIQKVLDPATGRTREGIEKRNTLLLVEHSPAVFTMGTRDCSEEMKIDPSLLGAELIKTDRGGRLTWHGEGQLVGYMVMNVRDIAPHFTLRDLVYCIEDTLIGALRSGWALESHRLSRS